MKTILLAMILLVSSSAAYAQEDPVVMRVSPDPDAGTAAVLGSDFGSLPIVEIAGTAVTILSSSPSSIPYSPDQLVVELPTVARQPGTYLLKIIHSNGQSDLFAFTVGKAGPHGDAGAAGPPGVQGMPGIQGPQGDTGESGSVRPDPPCYDDASRYVVCGNGTITDTMSGLIWLQRADCLPVANWAAANQSAVGLKNGECNLTDGSAPGDWRLPTEIEWRAMMTTPSLDCLGAGSPGPPNLMNDAGTRCFVVGPSSFTGVTNSKFYWSSDSDRFPLLNGAVRADLNTGETSRSVKTARFAVWPVRDGAR